MFQSCDSCSATCAADSAECNVNHESSVSHADMGKITSSNLNALLLPSHAMFPYWLAHCCGGPCLSSLFPCGRFGHLLALVSRCPNRVMRLTGEAAEYIALSFITETTAIENCRWAPYKTVIFILLISERDHHKQKLNLQETLESELLGRLNDLKLFSVTFIEKYRTRHQLISVGL